MLSRREERLLRSLRQRKAREAEGLFLAEGVRAVEDLLASPLPIHLAVAASSLGDTPRGQALLDVLAHERVALHEATGRELAALADTETPQGILAVAPIPSAGLGALRVEDHDPAVVLVLDAVQDPGNFGTLARTAEALGAVGLVALPGTVDPWNPKSVRAAMGSTFRLPVVEAGWDDLAPWLASHGVETLAAVVGGAPLGEG
ncbi:MAG TPA: RNA methyltransferase, partial [Longimicrobium sp.]